MPCSGVGVGVRGGAGIFDNGGVKLGLGAIDGMGDANGEGELGNGIAGPTLAPNRLVCPPKSGCTAVVVVVVISASFEGVPQAFGVGELNTNPGKLVGTVNRGPEGPGVVVGVVVVVVTFSAEANDDGVEAGVVVGGKIADDGFSPGVGNNDVNGGIFGRDESSSVDCAGVGGFHCPKGILGAAGCATITGGADRETGGGFSVSPSRIKGVLASGELRMGRLFGRGTRQKGEVDGGEALSVGTGICTGAGGVSLTGEPGGVVLGSLTGDTRGTLEGEDVWGGGETETVILGGSALGVVDGDLVNTGVLGKGASVGSDSSSTCSSGSSSSDTSDDASDSSSSDTSDDASDSSSSDASESGTSDRNESASSCNSASPAALSSAISPSSSAETFTKDELVEDDIDSKDGS